MGLNVGVWASLGIYGPFCNNMSGHGGMGYWATRGKFDPFAKKRNR